jgi:hypothetical protein
MKSGYPFNSAIDYSLRHGFAVPPPSLREALAKSATLRLRQPLLEGAVSEADWGSGKWFKCDLIT